MSIVESMTPCNAIATTKILCTPKMSTIEDPVNYLIDIVKSRDEDQIEFVQAASEVIQTLGPVFEKNPEYVEIMENMLEPERQIIFRVPWLDDQGKKQVNRGYRVQFNSALGPYKGGLRFHPSVTLSVIKFLGFEQILKNSLTTLPIGGGKGGSDFNPKGRSDAEVMRFCQSFMSELVNYIGPNRDVPAGDINVGRREIGYLFGQYKRLQRQFEGSLTGKHTNWGGSFFRPEATGYGVVYYADNVVQGMLDTTFEGKKCIVSGSGNVATFLVEKLLQLGAVVITMSDSKGYILEKDGFTQEQLEHIMFLKGTKRTTLSEYTEFSSTAEYFEGERPWGVEADYAFPCATQNEVEEEDAKNMVANGIKLLAEGANMPCTNEAIEILVAGGVTFGPAKAANAGGVAVSALEMAQNAQHMHWKPERVDSELKEIMKNIYESSLSAAEEYGITENKLQVGANIAGFLKVAEAMVDQGCV
eukprot:TRINITY_DN4212_c0_g1_i1.p1 TRINITY_DN4212_c0_g1~~TRINITY_DN4212_c0_g1_i1.p1  ORF type:complete len:474 (-),score=170.92 TRINITY_DN4212_c0_g1_i1:297-1718(-)